MTKKQKTKAVAKRVKMSKTKAVAKRAERDEEDEDEDEWPHLSDLTSKLLEDAICNEAGKSNDDPMHIDTDAIKGAHSCDDIFNSARDLAMIGSQLLIAAGRLHEAAHTKVDREGDKHDNTHDSLVE